MFLDAPPIRPTAPTERPSIDAAARACPKDARRVLFISYPFPPVGGAGVQRTTKFVKYLPHWGWMPSVLTVANPSVPAWDQSLVKDVPAEVTVRRARTYEPSYATKAGVTGKSESAGNGQAKRGGAKALASAMVHRIAKLVLQPDPQILWLPHAIREGRKLLDQIPHAAIVASGPPFSTFLIGASLAQHSGLPLILDYRDEWDISNSYWENKKLDRFSLLLQQRMQYGVVRAASALVATTRHSADALARVRDRAKSRARATWIYNGYDSEDFETIEPPATPKPTYRLSYVGTLWNLTSTEPLVAAIELLASRTPDVAARLEVVFAGRRTPQQSQILARLKSLPCRLVEHPYLDHDGAMELVQSSDGLCALLSDLPGAARVVPAKIFEYMAARRAIIAIGPTGEMWDLLRDCPAARLNTPSDIEGIARTLTNEIERVGAGRPLEGAAWDASAYDRRNEARQLSELLNTLAPTAGGKH